MKFWNTCVLSLLVLVVIALAAGSKNKVRLCGKRLSDMIQVVCKGKYHSNFVRKRRDVRPFDFKFDQVINRVRRQLIVGECCRSACALATLKTYCHSNNDNVRKDEEIFHEYSKKHQPLSNNDNDRKDEEIFHEYSKKHQPLSNNLQRETDQVQNDEPPREIRPSTFISNEVVKGAPNYENFAYHEYQNLHKGKLVWGNYYD